jgi:hypothetical protein
MGSKRPPIKSIQRYMGSNVRLLAVKLKRCAGLENVSYNYPESDTARNRFFQTNACLEIEYGRWRIPLLLRSPFTNIYKCLWRVKD